MIVWLWDVPRPGRSGCGVSGDKDRAREAAEEFLRDGAGDARVEAASFTDGTDALTSGYRRTGDGWQARPGPRGLIRWVPLPPRA